MSLPASLVVPALEELVTRTGAVETLGADGGPFLTLRTVDGGEPAGRVRVFSSERVPRIVYSNLDLAGRGMDTHMFYAFTAAGSAVPHFTLDAVATRGILAFHVDLVPRVDLATHVEYMDAVYLPLDELHREVTANEALTPASVPSRGRALMSPWNWDGLPYIVKFNFMYLTEVCTEPGEKEAIFAHLRGFWQQLEAAGVPFKAHWGKINFIDPAFARRNHRLDAFRPLAAPMFMNDYLAERIGALDG